MFAQPPIEFRASRNIPIEAAMYEVYAQQHITIPIIHIREKLYLIGSGRMTCDYRSDTAMVKVGGGYEKFEDYVAKNERYHQKRLATYMINNQASLEWVVQRLIEGKNIQTGVSSNMPFRGSQSLKSSSPVRRITASGNRKAGPISPISSKRRTTTRQ